MPEIELDGEIISYERRISSKATKPRIDSKFDGFKVVIPEGEALEPENLLESNKSWILNRKTELEQFKEEIPNREFKDREQFPFLGNEYQISIEDSKSKIEDRKIILSKTKTQNKPVRTVIEELYRRKAREIISRKVEKYLDKIDGAYDKIYIRNQKTKWGSCSPKDNLSFNWRLLLAPEHVLEYVVVHELVHLEEKNHDQSFWRRVRELYPNYKDSNRWLNRNSAKLIIDSADLR